MDIVNGLSREAILEATSWRHYLHTHPELAYQEQGTSDFIASKLSSFGLKVHRGLAGTGVVGTLTRGVSRRTIGIRADMDALPIQELSGTEYTSQHTGVMHACGHDGHVAMALAAARACSDLRDLNGMVHFIFQPAEEGEGGAKRMVEEGLFRRFPCNTIYALHNWPALPLGTCVVRNGPVMAAVGMFEIEISGRGCHGAFPHEGTDVLLTSCQLVSALQTIVTRSVDPTQAAVVSATQIHAGDTWNTIPSRCMIRGTARWFKDSVGDILERRISELAQSIAMAFGCEAQVCYERRSPATVNDAGTAHLVRDVVTGALSNLTLVDVEPSTASEDFSFMQQVVPGCYIARHR